MKTLAIDIPEDILLELKIPKQRWGVELRKELALQLYRENLLPFGHARRGRHDEHRVSRSVGRTMISKMMTPN